MKALLLIVLLLVGLAFAIFEIAAIWKIFTKAEKPGWAAIIPFYSTWVLLKIVGRPGWWLILLFIPIVNVIVGIIIAIDLAKSFGKDVLFALGMIFLGFVFYPILGFGPAEYRGPAALQTV